MSSLSSCMLRINQEPRYFTELFYELKSYSSPPSTLIEASTAPTLGIPKSITINAFNYSLANSGLSSMVASSTLGHHHRHHPQNVHHQHSRPGEQQSHPNSINSVNREKFYKQQSASAVNGTASCNFDSRQKSSLLNLNSVASTASVIRGVDLAPKPVAYCI